MKDCLVVIPARYASKRFPGKVLALLGGRPVVEWCWRAAVRSGVGPVLVATEDVRVVRRVEAFGGKAVLTSKSCASGSDRVHEAARGRREPLVINLQSDMPFVRPATLRRVAEVLRRRVGADIATAVIPLRDERRAKAPQVVKAALARDGRALYFSRAPIPFPRDGQKIKRFEHLGIYGFRRKALDRFVDLEPTPLELCECLEQLRALENGMTIYAAVVSDTGLAIDTPGDLEQAKRLLRQGAA